MNGIEALGMNASDMMEWSYWAGWVEDYLFEVQQLYFELFDDDEDKPIVNVKQEKLDKLAKSYDDYHEAQETYHDRVRDFYDLSMEVLKEIKESSKKDTYVWAVRNYEGQLYIYDDGDKPFKKGGVWVSVNRTQVRVNFELPNVRWGNDEPTRIKIEVVDDGN